MSVMPGRCLVFNVTGVDSNLSRFFFGSTINIFVAHGFTPSLLGEDLGDGLSESGFAVIDMADGTDVDVRFVAFEFVSCGGKRTSGNVKPWSVLRGQQALGGLLSNRGSEPVHVGRGLTGKGLLRGNAGLGRVCVLFCFFAEVAAERPKIRIFFLFSHGGQI